MKVNHIITLSSRMISKSRGPHQREGPSQDVPGCRRSCGGNPHKSPMVCWFKLQKTSDVKMCEKKVNIIEYQSTLTAMLRIGAFCHAVSSLKETSG